MNTELFEISTEEEESTAREDLHPDVPPDLIKRNQHAVLDR